MATRSYEFVVGPETPDVPTSASPVTSSFASPSLITAGGGITPGGSAYYEVIYVAGNGGPIDVSANPQIAAGDLDGQMLVIYGTHETNYVLLENGTGLALNGDMILRLGSVLSLLWDDPNQVWREISRTRGG